MLRWRLTLGSLLIGSLGGLCWIDHSASRRGIVLAPIVIGLGFLATAELLRMFARRGTVFPAFATHIAVATVLVLTGLATLFPVYSLFARAGATGWLAIGIAAGLFVVLVNGLRRYRPQSSAALPGATIVETAVGALAVVYIGGMLGFLVLLRNVSADDGAHDWGMLALLSMIVVVKLGDTGAYTFGRLFGKNKMAPKLSPGKTWEGTLGGLACSCVGAWLMLVVAPRWLGWRDATPPSSFIAVFIYGLAVGIAGVLGDLVESLYKRDAGVKDSSDWMPGFGGVLDILDSLLLAAPVAYLFWVAGWMGGIAAM